MTFKQFIWSELKYNTIKTTSTLIFGLSGWAVAFVLSLLVTRPTATFYEMQVGIFLILAIICSISEYDLLRKRYRLYQLQQRIDAVKQLSKLNRWDGRAS